MKIQGRRCYMSYFYFLDLLGSGHSQQNPKGLESTPFPITIPKNLLPPHLGSMVFSHCGEGGFGKAPQMPGNTVIQKEKTIHKYQHLTNILASLSRKTGILEKHQSTNEETKTFHLLGIHSKTSVVISSDLGDTEREPKDMLFSLLLNWWNLSQKLIAISATNQAKKKAIRKSPEPRNGKKHL